MTLSFGWLTNCLIAILCLLCFSTATPVYAQELRPNLLRDGTSLIVFVHGFRDDGGLTWTNEVTGEDWQSLIEKDQRFDQFDVFSFHYDSSISGSVNISVSDVSTQLSFLLAQEEFKKYHRIYFIAHSMGGLVVRNLLLKNRDLAETVPVVVFLATPTNGSKLANYATALRLNRRQLEALETLDQNNFLQDQTSQWRALRENVNVDSFCVYELVPTFGAIVVDQQSAAALCDGQVLPASTNHSGVAKPKSAADIIYSATAAKILGAEPRLTDEPKPNQEVSPISPSRISKLEFYGQYDTSEVREIAEDVTFSPNGDILAVVVSKSKENERVLRIIGTDRWDVLAEITMERGNIFESQFSPDGRFLLMAGFLDGVAVFDSANDWERTTIQDRDRFRRSDLRFIHDFAFIPTEVNTIVTAADDGLACVIILANVNEDRCFENKLASGKPDELFSVAVSPHGDEFAVGTKNGNIHRWSITNNQSPIASITNLSGWPNDLEYISGGDILLAAIDGAPVTGFPLTNDISPISFGKSVQEPFIQVNPNGDRLFVLDSWDGLTAYSISLAAPLFEIHDQNTIRVGNSDFINVRPVSDSDLAQSGRYLAIAAYDLYVLELE